MTEDEIADVIDAHLEQVALGGPMVDFVDEMADLVTRLRAPRVTRLRTPQREDGHHLGRVHDGMRWCMDRGCNWGRAARQGER